jgi:hypothetical protein
MFDLYNSKSIILKARSVHHVDEFLSKDSSKSSIIQKHDPGMAYIAALFNDTSPLSERMMEFVSLYTA